MKHLRRWIIIPVLLVLVAALLLLLGKVRIDTDLPLNIIAPIAAAVAGFILLLLMGLEAQSTVKSWNMPEPEDPPRSEDIIYPKPLDDAHEAVETAEKFSKRATDRVMIDIEIDDSTDE